MNRNGLFVGVDPGTKKDNLGLALVDYDGKLVDCCSVTDWLVWSHPCDGPKDSLSDKLWNLKWRFADAFVNKISIKTAGRPILLGGIEDQWVGKNSQVALTLSKQFGAIFAALSDLGVYSVKIQPTQAKKALTGSGRADKETMVQFAQQMGMGGDNDNVADAIGIALAARAIYKEWEIENQS